MLLYRLINSSLITWTLQVWPLGPGGCPDALIKYCKYAGQMTLATNAEPPRETSWQYFNRLHAFILHAGFSVASVEYTLVARFALCERHSMEVSTACVRFPVPSAFQPPYYQLRTTQLIIWSLHPLNESATQQ
jgi:hypothetical protein